jgi:endonuclease/exonuclease/phosphatase (EEP) superfamily protein YafD
VPAADKLAVAQHASDCRYHSRTSADSQGDAAIRSSKSTTILVVVAILGLGAAGAGLTAQHLPIDDHATLIAAAFSPYLILAAPLSLAVVVVALAKHWFAALLAVVLAVTAVAAQFGAIGDSHARPTAGTPVRIMTANLMLGMADANAVVKRARDNADIVALQELTPDAVHRLSHAGLDQTFPFRFAYPGAEGGGAGLWSRYPIVSPRFVEGFDMAFISARVEVKTGVDPTILVAHVSGPWPQPITGWLRDIGLLATTMDSVARKQDTGAVIVAGDFNSTMDMLPFRQLLRNGYTDAALATGRRSIATFPQMSRVPPLLGIDHVLVRNCTPTAIRAVDSPGSDHRALLAEITIPS